MTCPRCGSQVYGMDTFCSACGTRLDGMPQSQPYYQPPQFAPVQPLAMAMPGSKMIRVSGIILIILSALAIIVSFALAGAARVKLPPVSVIMLLVVNGFALVMGILGVLKHSTPSFGLFFIISGALLIFLGILFLALAGGSLGLGNLVLAILYIVGGAKLRKAVQSTGPNTTF